jgi:hypothetical protein
MITTQVKVKTAGKKRMMAIGRGRPEICPTCRKRIHITVTSTGDGWESWQCAEGHVNEYRIMGVPN